VLFVEVYVIVFYLLSELIIIVCRRADDRNNKQLYETIQLIIALKSDTRNGNRSHHGAELRSFAPGITSVYVIKQITNHDNQHRRVVVKYITVKYIHCQLMELVDSECISAQKEITFLYDLFKKRREKRFHGLIIKTDSEIIFH